MNQKELIKQTDFENYYEALKAMKRQCNSTEHFVQRLAYLFADLGAHMRGMNGIIALFQKEI